MFDVGVQNQYGPLVKRLRRSPLKAQSRVRFSYGSPFKNPAALSRRDFVLSHVYKTKKYT